MYRLSLPARLSICNEDGQTASLADFDAPTSTFRSGISSKPQKLSWMLHSSAKCSRPPCESSLHLFFEDFSLVPRDALAIATLKDGLIVFA